MVAAGPEDREAAEPSAHEWPPEGRPDDQYYSLDDLPWPPPPAAAPPTPTAGEAPPADADAPPAKAEPARSGNPPLRYLLSALRVAAADEAAFGEMQSVMTDFRPRKVSKWHSDVRIGQDELYDHLERVLDAMRAEEPKAWRPYISLSTLKDWSKRGLWPFQNKVSKREVPSYYTVIKHPMHLGEMARKLKAWLYNSKAEFAHDLLLIWDNCLFFNANPESMYHKVGLALQRKSRQLLATVPDVRIRVLSDTGIVEGLNTAAAEPSEHGGGSDSAEDAPVASPKSPSLPVTPPAAAPSEAVPEPAQAEEPAPPVEPPAPDDVLVVADGTAFHDAVESPPSAGELRAREFSERVVPQWARFRDALVDGAAALQERTPAGMGLFLARESAVAAWVSEGFQGDVGPPLCFPEWQLGSNCVPALPLEAPDVLARSPTEREKTEDGWASPTVAAMRCNMANISRIQQLHRLVQRLPAEAAAAATADADVDGSDEELGTPLPAPDDETAGSGLQWPEAAAVVAPGRRMTPEVVRTLIKTVAAQVARHAGFETATGYCLDVLADAAHALLRSSCRLLGHYRTSVHRPRGSNAGPLWQLHALLGQLEAGPEELQTYVQRDVFRHGQRVRELRLKLELAYRVAGQRVRNAGGASAPNAHVTPAEVAAAWEGLCGSLEAASGKADALFAEWAAERVAKHGVPHVRVRLEGHALEKAADETAPEAPVAVFRPLTAADVEQSARAPRGSGRIIGLLVPYFNAKAEKQELLDDDVRGRTRAQRERRAQLLRLAGYAARNKRPGVSGGKAAKSRKVVSAPKR